MELTPGYKRTEVGIIPDDWDVVRLGDLKPFITSGSRGWADYYSDQGDLFVRITNLSRANIRLDLSNCRFVKLPAEAREGVRTQLSEHDVLISITADIGIIGYIDATIPSPAYINQHIALVRFNPIKANGKFVSYFLASDKPQDRFRATTDTGAKAGMSLLAVEKIQTALPHPKEQHAIAEALSDVDELLSALDRLIAKKRGLKQATMQQLLTGQTRLPGFSGKWEVKTLGELATFLSGGTPSRSNDDYWTGTIPWISATSLRCFEIWRSDSNVTKEAVIAGSKMAPVGSSLLLVRGSALHKEILCGLVTSPVCFNQDVKALVPNPQVIPRFLTICIKGSAEYLLKLVSSAGNTAGVLDTKLLKAFVINLPQRDEQAAIAQVLSDMDVELTALAQRREKTRAIKQGMMQELLTGKTRLY